MQVNEALEVLDQILGASLRDLHSQIFLQVWQGKTYAEIADELGYEHGYIRDLGCELWQQLSRVIQKKVTKCNVRTMLRQYAQAQAPAEHYPPLKLSWLPQVNLNSLEPFSTNTLKFPSGPVGLDSAFYIERPPLEVEAKAEIQKPGSLLRIEAPQQMGKTSLAQRILAYARDLGFYTVTLNFQKADQSCFGNLDLFLRWFCSCISHTLGQQPQLDLYWNYTLGSKVSSTDYLQQHILEAIDRPLVLVLDDLNQLFHYPDLCQDVLPLFRAWHEDASDCEVWQKLRLILVHDTKAYSPLTDTRSPFNVGRHLQLQPFSPEQVQDLGQRYHLEDISEVYQLVGGQPALVQIAFYHLATANMGLQSLLQNASTLSGIYSGHLRSILALLEEDPNLVYALTVLLYSSESLGLDALILYRLESLGLITLEGYRVKISCNLYRQFLKSQLEKTTQIVGTDQPYSTLEMKRVA